MDKKEIRKNMISKRDNILKEEKEIMDKNIILKLKESEYYKKSKNIFIYLGFGSEIDTMSYIQEFINEGKHIFIPRTDIKTKKMEAVEITSLEGLRENKYGILEPDDSKEEFYKNNLDLIILPGVAFDLVGKRIGYGGGYYDRYLENIDKKIMKVALIYDFQLLENVPAEEHDIKADYIITETMSIKCC
ncbi:MAG: 5-formyltetrahydrofolate cyclo-ligase [Clostridium sp.]